MHKKIVLFPFVSALLLLATFGTQIIMPVSASTYDVSPGESIQAAITSAQAGDTIFVHAGTYYEHVKVNRTVSLVGENRVTTIVDGGGTGPIIKATANNANVTGFTIQNGGTLPYSGLFVGNSTGNKISNNIIRNSAYGIELFRSNGSSIIGNTIINNSWAGIFIHDSNENIIYDNIMANNSIGAWISSSDMPNTFYHNNFINNLNQASDYGSSNWDNGTEGNYWSDYMGVDTDGDIIGDTPHEMDPGMDYFPLIIPTRPFPVVWDNVIYQVAMFSNSTVSSFYFNQPSKEIGFNVTGLLNTTGFCNITIPKQLLRGNPWKVYDEGENQLSFTPSANATHTSLYLIYNHSIQMIRIIGTEVIPEFPVAIFLPLFTIATLIAVILRKRKKGTFKL